MTTCVKWNCIMMENSQNYIYIYIKYVRVNRINEKTYYRNILHVPVQKSLSIPKSKKMNSGLCILFLFGTCWHSLIINPKS